MLVMQEMGYCENSITLAQKMAALPTEEADFPIRLPIKQGVIVTQRFSTTAAIGYGPGPTGQ